MVDNVIYFDTNIYNSLAKSLTIAEVEALRIQLIGNGKRPAISPVNILEILATRDNELREKIIMVCQHLCDPEMLAEPEALLIDYICSRSPRAETAHLVLTNQFSNSDLSRTWKDVQSDKERTLLLGAAEVAQIDVFKNLHGFFHAHYSRGNRITELELPDFYGKEAAAKVLQEAACEVRKKQAESPRTAILCENRALVAQTLLCAGLSPFPQFIDEYWSAVGISSIEDRYSYVRHELEYLFEEGPIVGLGSYMGWQATKATSKGNFFDCMHFLYLPYVELFCTEDGAFREFAGDFPKARILDRIVGRSKVFG